MAVIISFTMFLLTACGFAPMGRITTDYSTNSITAANARANAAVFPFFLTQT